MPKGAFRGGRSAAIVLALLLVGTVAAQADLLEQGFAGTVDSSGYTNIGSGFSISGSVIYLPAVQLPAVQLGLTIQVHVSRRGRASTCH